ncbi:MAG: hypothetical protein WCR67_02255 [Bacilli bacterium]
MKKPTFGLLLCLGLLASCNPVSASVSTEISASTSTSPSVSDSVSDSESVSDIASESTSVSDSSEDEGEEVSLDSIYSLLRGDLNDSEVRDSNKVVTTSVDDAGSGTRITTNTEELNIYSDHTSLACGTDKVQYGESSSYDSQDTYEREICSKNYSGQDIFYYVIDYADGTKRESWKDTAKRLPIYDSATSGTEGTDYLLASSLASQITKQASLLTASFLSTHIINNADVQTIIPTATMYEDEGIITYELKDFSYQTTDDDDSIVDTLIEFEIVVDDGKLMKSTLRYNINQQRDDEEYIIDDVTTYEISYGDREASSTDELVFNPEDYFIETVDSVKSFYFDNGKKVYVDKDKLPLGKYIRFEADVYTPSKAVDLDMTPETSTDSTVIEVSTITFDTLKAGTATLTMSSATGVFVSVDVTVITENKASRISYADASAGFEKEGTSDNFKTYMYTGQTYEGIYLTVRPASAIDDIQVIVSDPEVLSVTAVSSSATSGIICYKYVVSATNNSSKSVSVTFKSLSNETVSYTQDYVIKDALSAEDLLAKATSHTYRWDNIYDVGTYGILTFDSTTKGTIKYYDGEGLIEDSVSTFSFTINGSEFVPTMDENAYLKYNGGEIALDGGFIVLRVNVTDYVHTFKIVSE